VGLGFGLLVGFIIDGWIDEVMTFHGMDIFLSSKIMNIRVLLSLYVTSWLLGYT